MSASTGVEPSAADRALTFVREAIIDGTFPGESMLSEAELAASLGVSRTPIRVALARLQDEGWVRIYPKRGAMVRGLSADEVADIAQARFVLESSGVSRASSEARVRLAQELAPLLEAQRAAFLARDIGRFIELTLAFHGGFLRAGANRYLIDLGERLSDRQRWMLYANQETLLERSDHIIDEHQRLLECLQRDDPDGFTEVLCSHITDNVASPAGAL